MKSPGSSVLPVAFGFALLLALPLVAAGAELDEMISSAQSAADHEAIAAHYDREAAEARTRAEEHRKMAAAYKSVSKKGGAVVVKRAPAEHCQKLAKRSEADAAAYEALAGAHREAAKQAK